MIIHAAGQSSEGNLGHGTFAISLVVKDEKELIAEAARLLTERVPFVPVFEPDAPYHGQFMALGVVPARREELRRKLRRLRKLE